MMEIPGERLARFLAHAGVASRRHAEQLIAAGRVQVNGVTIREQGSRIDPRHDIIRVDGRIIQSNEQHAYLLLHKPVGYLCTVSDPQGRPTVLDLLPLEIQKLRVYPVGRLDYDTSGLLLLTNDGDFALHLTHPRYALDKHYTALVDGRPSHATLHMLRQGVTITEDNGRKHKTAPAHLGPIRHEGERTLINLTIHEGRKRQVRRMLAVLGLPVLSLKRVGIGSITLGNLAAGKWRYLTEDEISSLSQSEPTSS
ncbi:MAG TPA: pseudouridine synthase [Ktedonobacteraceae bacterium]|nr:pseudouridine synthase [Ktedonobacteraceae bacterium]